MVTVMWIPPACFFQSFPSLLQMEVNQLNASNLRLMAPGGSSHDL